jgi:nucleoside diphosphate kinase
MGKWDESYQMDKWDFLVGYLSSGLSHWFISEGEDAIRLGREVIIEIREKYLVDRKTARYNMTHASDSVESAEREIGLHF